jgi:phenylalanyl-tRNA synthetase beta chain
MRVSLNTIKQYIDFELPQPDELVGRINEQLGGVEEVIDIGKRYEKIVIVKVVSAGPMENSDHLSICRIDDGSGIKDVPRGDDGLVQVLTGAPNIHAGMWAVWLPPASTVPASYSDKEPFVLASRSMRGEMSHGMLASAKELAIGDSHEGLLEIDPNEWKPNTVEIKPGVSFAEAYGLDDTLIDIENKMFTHRPDLFGQLGVAREIAGILGHRFVSPEWYLNEPLFKTGEGLPLDVFNDTPENVPRFMAVAMKNVEIKPSPLWLQIELMRLGGKAINNIVDVTNYVMLLTAQPTHAYDYDKLRGGRLGARMAKKGEKATLLNGKTYGLDESDIVITDGEGVIGMGGIMGGLESEVTHDTKNIVLEVSNFDMYEVRKSRRRHGIFTVALSRFNMGQSPLQNDRILNLLMMSIQDVAGGEQASDVFDKRTAIRQNNSVSVTQEFINDRLGLELTSEDMKTLLDNVEMKVQDGLNITPPFWRTDIELPEDVIEEVGRLYGFDKLPRELPTRSIKPAPKNPSRGLKYLVREALSRAGANEVLTYSFVHEKILKNAGQNTDNAYRLSNALSPDLHYYRLGLTPSLLGHIHANIKAGYDEFALFELNKAHDKNSGLNNENVPVEHDSVALVYASKRPREGASFYQAKAILEFLADQLHAQLAYEPLGDQSTSPVAAPFESKHAAILTDAASGEFIGILGEYTEAVTRNFKLPEYAAGFEIDTEALLRVTAIVPGSYTPLSRYPGTERDISFRVGTGTSYADIVAAAAKALDGSGLKTSITPLDIYQPESGESKTVTIRIKLTPLNRTLTSDDASDIMSQVAASVTASTGASVV